MVGFSTTPASSTTPDRKIPTFPEPGSTATATAFTPAAAEHHVVWICLQRARRDLRNPLAKLPGQAGNGIAGGHQGSAGNGPHSEWHHRAVATDRLEIRRRHAQGMGGDLDERGPMALSLRGRSRRHPDPSQPQHGRHCRLERPQADCLDAHRHPKPQVPTLDSRLLLLGSKFLQADPLHCPPQHPRVVPRVELLGPGPPVEKTGGIGRGLGLHQVAEPDLHRIEIEAAGHTIHDPLHGEPCLGTTSPAREL